MKKELTVKDLLKKDDGIAFMGSDWSEDGEYLGEVPCINCNDVFFWACSDAEPVTEETMPIFQQCVDDCDGDLDTGSILYCARIKKFRPQDGIYRYIDEKYWPLFDACGPERETDFFNPLDRNGNYLYTEEDEECQ